MKGAPDRTPLQVMEALEQRHDLFGFRVEGWSAWRVLRFPVHTRISALPLAQPTRPGYQRILEALRATVAFAWLLLCGRRRELVIKTFRSALRLATGDKFRDVYFDGLIARGHSCLKLEVVNSGEFDRQAAAAWRPRDLDAVVFSFWGRVLGKLFPAPAGDFCVQVSRLLEEEAGAHVPAAWLHLHVSRVFWQARLYSLLLKRIRPRAVLVADTGDFAFRIASLRCGVRFIEIQHGVFDPEHPDVLPEWVPGTDRELLLPDRLACYGEYWIERLRGARQGKGIAVAVGNELIDLAREKVAARQPGEPCHLVLTSQGLDSARLVEWIGAMISAAPSDLHWHLSIKLHPQYDAGTRAFDGLKSHPRVSVIGGAEQPNVFGLLSRADLHLSIASTCHFDAAALGVRSLVVPLAGHEYMLPALEGLRLMLARTPAEVWEVLKLPPVGTGGNERFATPGFLDNLQRLLP